MSTAENTATGVPRVPARAWAILVVTYLAGFTAPLAQFKVPALADWLIPAVIVPVTTDPTLINTYFGLLMTALTIIGVIMAFPASFIARKIGLKTMVLTAIACIFVGTALALTDSFALLCIGRFLEGVGLSLLTVAGPSCLTLWFPPQKHGVALGVWATWVPMGITVAFNIAPVIASNGGWHAMLWACLVLDVIAFVLFAVIFKMPESASQLVVEGSFKDGWKYLKSPKLWVLAAFFFCFNVVQLGIINTYYNQFLTSIGLSSQVANSMTSIPTVIGIVTAIIGGFIFDRLPYNRKNVLWIVAFAGQFIGYCFAFATGEHALALIWFSVIFTGIFNGVVVGTVMPYAPSLVPRTALAATMVMAFIACEQNLAPAIGSPLYGALMSVVGWQGANFIMVLPLLAICFVLSIVINTKPLNRRQAAVEAANEAQLAEEAAE